MKRRPIYKNKVFFGFIIAAVAVCVPFAFSVSANTWDAAELAKLEMYSSESKLSGEVVVASALRSVDMPQPTATPIPQAITADAENNGLEVMTIDKKNSSGYKAIAYGEDDPIIVQIQQRLMDLNYMEVDEPTTKLGPITSQALEYFQRKNGLEITGEADVKTQQVLFSDEAQVYMVSEGASGLDVEQIQERLKELGYSVSATGYYGSDTVKAVMKFQQRNDLTDDGMVGRYTKEALFSKDAVKAENASSNTKPDKTTDTNKDTSSDTTDKKQDSDNNSGGSGNSSGGSSDVPPANSGSVDAFINAAYAQLGKPYVLGGKGPDVFDCSGFVYYSLNLSGYSIDYMTSGGWAGSGFPTISSMNDLQRGDIVCFNGHVGIYLGGGDMIDASSSQGKIRISGAIQNNSYWVSNFICGKRPL